MNIIFWGVRGSTPCANAHNMRFGGNTTCLQIRLPDSDELLILDCGTGFRNLGNALHAEGNSHKGKIFITHPHWDHLQGFPFFKPFYDSTSSFRIYIPPQGIIGCKEILQGHMSGTFFPVSIDMLQANITCETFQIGKMDFEKFSVEYMWAHHTIPTAIYKLTIAEQVIIFAPDNEIPLDGSPETEKFLEDFRKFIHGADIVIHDAQYNKQQYRDKQGWGHSAWEPVVEIARQEQVKQLYLAHHDPDNDDDYLFNLDEQIKEQFGDDFRQICLVKEGQEVKLSLAKFDEMINDG